MVVLKATSSALPMVVPMAEKWAVVMVSLKDLYSVEKKVECSAGASVEPRVSMSGIQRVAMMEVLTVALRVLRTAGNWVVATDCE
jgi:hypothetical protein